MSTITRFERRRRNTGILRCAQNDGIFFLRGEGGADLRGYFFDGDRGEAALAFYDAGFELAAHAADLVEEDAVLRAVREPETRGLAGGEDGYAGGSDGRGQMHGAGVVAEEEAGEGEGGGAFAGGELAAEVEDE
jgi:hypothetical protein